MANLQLVYKEICQVSFQAINNFLLNQNNVDFQNNILDLQSNDLTNLKFSDNSLSNLSKSPTSTIIESAVWVLIPRRQLICFTFSSSLSADASSSILSSNKKFPHHKNHYSISHKQAHSLSPKLP